MLGDGGRRRRRREPGRRRHSVAGASLVGRPVLGDHAVPLRRTAPLVPVPGRRRARRRSPPPSASPSRHRLRRRPLRGPLAGAHRRRGRSASSPSPSRGPSTSSTSGSAAVGAAALVVVLPGALGAWVRTRAELVTALEERAERAEAERELLARDAVLTERTRIAREMHDAVGHRVSLMVLQAGAIEMAAGDRDRVEQLAAPGADRRPAGARRAAPDGRGAARRRARTRRSPRSPASTTSPRLVEESPRGRDDRRAAPAPAGAAPVDPAVGRAAYRIVQEALTNARQARARRRGDASTVERPARPARRPGRERRRRTRRRTRRRWRLRPGGVGVSGCARWAAGCGPSHGWTAASSSRRCCRHDRSGCCWSTTRSWCGSACAPCWRRPATSRSSARRGTAPRRCAPRTSCGRTSS